MGQFFKQAMASLVGTLAGLLIFLGIGAGSLAILVFALASQDSTPPIEDKSFLVFDLATQITDSEKPVTLQQVLSGEETSSLTLRQVLQAIAEASQDDRIQGIFLDGRKAGMSSGYATLTEIRDALTKFKATGKQILAYDNDLTESGYYLTSIADKILLNPMGSLQVNGLASQQTFFAQAFKKYGIGVQVVRVGSFKAAVEPFIRSDFSPENQEQLQALLADIWNIYLAKIADSRGLTTAQVQAIANDQGIITAENAKKEKLIDQTAYFDQVLDDLKKLTDNESEKTFRQVALSRYVDNLKNKSSSSAPKLAIIYADGTIVDGQGELQQVGDHE
jgi:protease-4